MDKHLDLFSDRNWLAMVTYNCDRNTIIKSNEEYLLRNFSSGYSVSFVDQIMVLSVEKQVLGKTNNQSPVIDQLMLILVIET